MLNVVHIITGLSSGGAESILCRLCAADKANRHYVIALRERGPSADWLDRAGIEVHCLDMPRGQIRLKGLVRLYVLLKQLRPDIVQTWMYHADLVGGIVSKVAGIRAIVWGIHNSTLNPTQSSRKTRIVAKILSYVSHWLPSRIVSCSISSAEIHTAMGYRADLFVVIPNGYQIAEFIPDLHARVTMRRSLGISESVLVLGMAARFDPQKDHNNLIDALAILKMQGRSFLCLLAGNGMVPNNEVLYRNICSHGLEDDVLLLGQCDDMPSVMNALDFHVLSSCSEAFPNVLNEAMACGVPCVTTDVGDAALIVGDAGWVVPPSNPQALAAALDAAIQEYLHNSHSWQQRKVHCRKYVVENFSLDRMVLAYNTVWSLVAAEAMAVAVGG
jgi:glycosyltransferase involved in cell wall biosynthesis